MSNFTIVLDRKEMQVTVEAGSIRIDCPGTKFRRIPVKMIDSVIVMGSPLISCGVWSLLSDKNIPAVILPLRGIGKEVYIGAGLSSSINKRRIQYKILMNHHKTISVARFVLKKKFESQKRLLIEIAGEQRSKDALIRKFENFQKLLYSSTNHQSLMGIEGTAAVYYFKQIRHELPGKWQFKTRNKRPPRDPVNALLSLSYVIVGNEIRREIIYRGFDPAAGFLHSIQAGRDSLMLDLIEPLRSHMDELVLSLIKNNLLNLKNFTTNSQDGCRLSKKGREVYYKEWAKWKYGENSKNIIRDNVKQMLEQIITISGY